MNYRVRHHTRYLYAQPVSQCYNLAYLLPRNTDRQTVDAVTIHISPTPQHQQEYIDYFGNRFLHFTIEQSHTQLDVDIQSEITLPDSNDTINLDFGTPCAYVKHLLANNTDWETLQAREFMLESPHVPLHQDLADYARSSFYDERPFLSAIMDLTQRIYHDFIYDPQFSTVATPLADVLKHRRGVCQDFAHLAIGCLRSLGYPARYVSGYLETLAPEGAEKLIGVDASHAWFAVYSPGEGWYDFDPTNNMLTKAQHITTAWGRDYSDVTPLKGILFGGGANPLLTVSVDVQAASLGL